MFGMHHRPRRLASALVAGILVCGTLAAAASALVLSSGTSQISMQNRAEAAASFFNGVNFTDIAGSSVTVTVPSGASRLVNARFTAESNCYGADEGSFTRILARKAGVEIQLNPGDDLAAFDGDADGASSDGLEGHAMERSLRLYEAGTWTIVVQRKVTDGTSFILDDWHHAVETTA